MTVPPTTQVDQPYSAGAAQEKKAPLADMIRRTPAAGTNAEAAEFAARHPLGLGVSYGTFPLMAKAIPQPIRRGRRTRTAASPGNAFRATAIATPTGR